MKSRFVLVMIVCCAVFANGCSFTSVVKSNTINTIKNDEQNLKIETVYWKDPSPKDFKIQKAVSVDRVTRKKLNPFTLEEFKEALKLAKDMSDTFKKLLPMKLEGVTYDVGVGKTAGVILQLQPTLVWKLAQDGGKRIEIETTVLKDNVKVWQATIAAFGPGSTENEQLVIDFISKIRNEMSEDNIIL